MHLIIDGYGSNPNLMQDEEFIYQLLDSYPAQIGMTKISTPLVFKYTGSKPEDWGISGLIFIAESDGMPVGFSLALPDINQALVKMNGKLFPFGIFKLLYLRRRIDQLRVLAMGVLPEYRNRGIDLSFYYHTFKNGLAAGFKRGELSWVREDNAMMKKMAKRVGGRIYKTYRLYEYPLT